MMFFLPARHEGFCEIGRIDIGPTIPVWQIRVSATAVIIVTSKRGGMDPLELCLLGTRS
jgi:hypothetical protein